MKKTLFIIGFILASAFFSSLSAPKVNAANDGSEKTAQQKLYYNALRTCIGKGEWKYSSSGSLSGSSLPKISTSTIQNLNWFDDDNILGGFTAGVFVEKNIGNPGIGSNGKIACDSESNALVKKSLPALGISYKDVFCDYKDNYATSTIIQFPNESSQLCLEFLEGDNMVPYAQNKDGALAYLDKLVTNKTFGDNVPGNNLLELTNLEKYYAYYDAFIEICALNEQPRFNNTEIGYQIRRFNESKEWTTAAVSKNDKGENTKVRVMAGAEDETCKSIADKLNDDTNPMVKAYKAEQEAKMAEDPSYSPGSTDSGSNTDSTEDPCYNSGVESMGWILCPAIANGTAAVDGIEQKLRDWLTIDPSSTLGNDTQDIWGKFRDIANIVIIIFFMVIIFSQLTGVGIDNYGIKKMLPKLIAMAILINLSYIICKIAIDISNILGVSLSNLMQNIAGGDIPTDTTAAIVGSLLATAAGVAASAGTVTAIVGVASGGGVMIIISIILALLVALVSVLMFFVMLAARSMIVIIFTVISPVAFALYILPNTQGLFKKWWKVFQAALVVYPICGALYGASYVIKKIVIPGGASTLNDNPEFLPRLIAVFAPFTPFLILPNLLKNALAALGMVGGALTMLGSGLKTGLNRGNTALKNSDRYKAAQERNMERRVQRRAGIDRNGNQKELGRFGRFWRGGDRGIARARVQYAKNQENRAREKDMMGTGFDAMLTGSEAKVEAQRVADQEALLTNGKEPNVNVNDADSVGAYHARLLKEHDQASSAEEKAEIMTKIKAAQNILSKTDTGRSNVQTNFEDAVKGGYSSGLNEASSHILGSFGDKYKSTNRGSHAMISDLATGKNIGDVQKKITDGTYAKTGTDKYTAESLAEADTQAIENLENNLSSMNNTEKNDIQATAYEALEKQKAGTLNIKPEVKKKLETIASGYTPKTTPEPAKLISHGAYEDAKGNVYHLREMNNGKYLDDNGVEVDITHFKKR